MEFELVPPPLQAWSTLPQRQLSKIDTVMFHRIGPELPGITEPLDAARIAGWFQTNGMAETGSPNMPYSFVVPAVGPLLWQAVPLSVRTPHANAWNGRAVSVACIGDFRKIRVPTPFQVEACKWIACRLQDTLQKRLSLECHSLVPGGTKHPKGHECPGAKFAKAFNEIERHVRTQFFVTK